MSSPDTFDDASLESFLTGLISIGFEPSPGTGRRVWVGPVDPAFAPLSSADTMRVVIRDGWPFLCPVLLVDGVSSNHLTAGGYVCMWEDDDFSSQWLTVEGFIARMAEWCNKAEHGWDPVGLARDAYLNFTKKTVTVAVFDPGEFVAKAAGNWAPISAAVEHETRLRLAPRLDRSAPRRGLWLSLGDQDAPPRTLEETSALLTTKQRRQLWSGVRAKLGTAGTNPNDAVDFVLLDWTAGDRPMLLPLEVRADDESAELYAMFPGPDDEASLLLRAGPDAEALRGLTVAVVGLGAVGGHAAVAVASSGVRQMRLIDYDVVLPGNVVRHVAGHHAVGHGKAVVVKVAINDHAPWTQVDTVTKALRSPADTAEVLEGVDLVVDATGSESGAASLAAGALIARVPIVSGALYRGGAVARVQRQGGEGDVPILDRRPEDGHVVIPAGDPAEETVEPLVGCSSPVNNAPPAAVLACAALLGAVVVDHLSGRRMYPDDVVDVLRVLPGEPPFDVLGRVRVAA